MREPIQRELTFGLDPLEEVTLPNGGWQVVELTLTDKVDKDFLEGSSPDLFLVKDLQRHVLWV